jgi:hypothetical protein
VKLLGKLSDHRERFIQFERQLVLIHMIAKRRWRGEKARLEIGGPKRTLTPLGKKAYTWRFSLASQGFAPATTRRTLGLSWAFPHLHRRRAAFGTPYRANWERR